jgi:hypothetical protein
VGDLVVLPPPTEGEDAQDLLELLEEWRGKVERGEVVGLAMVGVTPIGGATSTWCCSNDRTSLLFTAISWAQRRLLDHFVGVPDA